MDTTKKFKELLQARSLKATNARIDLLMLLQSFGSAVPFSTIQNKLPNVDRVTVYRTLDSLLEQGIIHKAYRENQETYYALCGNSCNSNGHRHDHVHFKCTDCKVVTCEQIHNFPNIELKNYNILKTTILLEGQCPQCS